MGLKINTNVDAINIHNRMTDTNAKVSDNLKRLSSGLRINSAKDDASGFAIANDFKAKVSSMRVASQNATEAQSMLQTADGAYSKVQDILIRMKNLATQAASGQTENLSTMNNEFSKLQDEIDRISNSTTYGSTKLVDGGVTASSAGVTFQVGATNVGTNQINVQLKGSTSGCLALSSAAMSAGGINIATASNAQVAMNKIDTALTSINSFMGEVGAYQNRLSYTAENLSISMENFQASESAIRDVDMAAEVMSFTKNQILQQSGMAMLSQANQAPQQVLTLLR